MGRKSCKWCGRSDRGLVDSEFCSSACRLSYEAKPCEWCGTTGVPKYGRFCGKSCSAKWRMSREDYKKSIYTEEHARKLSEATKRIMAEDPERCLRSSKRMIEHNPMQSAETRAKVSLAMKNNHVLGSKVIRGGNGKGASPCEQAIFDCFPCLVLGYVQSLGHVPGYPHHYKIDLAYPERKVGIEIDGGSHCTLERQSQDRKKEAKLSELGWTIVRFTNRQVKEDLEGVVACLQRLFQEK